MKEVKHKFRSPEEWQALGVKVLEDAGDFPRESRETVVSFINSMPQAEVDTAEVSWMKRLETDGAQPYHITTYAKSDGQYRSYLIPKGWVKRPYKSSATVTDKKGNVEGLAKARAKLKEGKSG
jgi:hypothetical protein